jgi:hypothetical protein
MTHRSPIAMTTTKTIIRPDPAGTPIEYRRVPGTDPDILLFESRALRCNGTPYDDRWWPRSDDTLLWLDLHQRDVLDFLWSR